MLVELNAQAFLQLDNVVHQNSYGKDCEHHKYRHEWISHEISHYIATSDAQATIYGLRYEPDNLDDKRRPQITHKAYAEVEPEKQKSIFVWIANILVVRQDE